MVYHRLVNSSTAPDKDPTLLTVGQLAWMNWDMLLVAVRPLLLSSGLSEAEVNVLIEDAQRG